MHAILRQSGRLAGISKTALRNTRRSVRPSLLPASYQRSRCYATNKRENPDSNDEKPSDPSNAARDSGTASNGAQSPNPKASTDGKHETFPLPGYIKLSEKEEQALMNLFDTLEKFPGSKVPVLTVKKEFMHAIKEFGIPKELHDLVKKVESGVPLSMSDAMKFAAWTRRLTSQMPPQIPLHGTGSKEDQKSSNPDSETEQKTEQKTSFKSNAPQTEQKGQKGQKQKGGNFNFEFDATTALATTFMTWLVFQFINPGESSKDITWQEFRTTFFDKGLVEKLTVQAGSRVRVDLHRDLLASVYPESPAINPKFYYYFTIGSVEAFERRLDEVQNELGIPSSERIPVTYVTGSSTWLDLLISFGPTLLILGLLYSATKRVGNNSGGGGGGIFSMGKSRAKMFNHDAAVKVTFKDVAGMDEAKLEIMEFVSFLKTPEQFSRLGAKIPRGAILSGPPGTGKTLLAKATAGESGVSFFSVSGSEFVEMFVGVGASRVRDMFSTARKNTPCIIFIDEIDAIGKARGKGNYGGNDEREATLNQILTEMDGFNTSEQVVVLAGTNRVDMLDKALLRPGRFDRHIAIDRPTMEGRKQIFKVHIGKIVTTEDIEHLTGRLAALTPGFAGADIANCVNEAALIAARTSAITVEQKHFEQAIERVIGGLEKKSLVLNPEEKKTVAYHEAGHAICGWYFKYADPLLKVSIIPRGQGVLGYAQYLPTGDTYLMNVNQLMDRMAMTLGGRISEELHFETVTSGASDDFQKVTHMATAMVTKWGMSKKIGPLHFPDTDEKFNKPFAESTAQSIDAEVRRIVDEAYKKCKDLLTEKKAEIGIVAEELLTKEVLGREDMIRMLGPRPFDDNKEFSKYFGGAPPPPPTEGIVPPASEAA